MNKEMYACTQDMRHAEASLLSHIEAFGDSLAAEEGYKELSGIEAVWYYLIQQHGWTPATVRSFNYEDLSLLMKERMSGWTLPHDLRGVEPGLPKAPR